MAGITQDIIEEIRSRCDIADVIGAVVQLRQRSGSSYTGLCPFHQEKTPSFHVDCKWQRYHCFGCGKDGDVFRFIMERDNISFPDAVRQLASQCGVIIPESSGEDVEKSRRKRDLNERLHKVNEEFALFFHRYLRENPRSPGACYLSGRGIPIEVAAKFKIGAVPEQRFACMEYGRALGFEQEDLIAAGICGKAEGSGRVYERFTGRLTFSIENEYGRGVGFSARSLEAKPADGRKYVNTPETPVYKKGALLYALPQAKESIAKGRRVILCEGQMDTIALHRAGFTNAVAPLGTAFTPEQAKLLKRYADTIDLAFDSDSAGQKAFLRAAEYILPLSISLNMIPIPGGKDPDELFRNGGAEAVAEAVNGKIPWLERLREMLPDLYDMATPVGRGQAAAFLAGLFNLVQNRVELESYIQSGAAILQVSQDAMYAELSRIRNREIRSMEMRKSVQNLVSPQQQPVKEHPENSALLTLLALAICNLESAREIGDLLPPDLPLEGVTGEALNMVIAAAVNGENEETVREQLNFLLAEKPSPAIGELLLRLPEFHNPSRAIEDSVNELKRLVKRRKYEETAAVLRNCYDPEERNALLKKLQEITKL